MLRDGMAEPVNRSFKVFPTQEGDRHNDDKANSSDWFLKPKRSAGQSADRRRGDQEHQGMDQVD